MWGTRSGWSPCIRHPPIFYSSPPACCSDASPRIHSSLGYVSLLLFHPVRAIRLITSCFVQLLQVSHVVVDEVHERSLDSDFLLVLLRDVLPHRPSLRVVLMSATLNAAAFSAYFKGAAVAQIPGFTREFIFISICTIRY